MLCLVVLKACVPKLCVLLYSAVLSCVAACLVCHCNELRRINFISIKAVIIITRQGEVFVLLYVFCSLFLSTISRQPAVRFMPHFACGRSGVLWFRMCLLPFWGLAAPRGGGWKRGKYRMRMAGLCQFYRHTCYYYYYLLLLLLLLLLLPLTWTMAVKTVYVPAEP